MDDDKREKMSQQLKSLQAELKEAELMLEGYLAGQVSGLQFEWQYEATACPKRAINLLSSAIRALDVIISNNLR